MITQATAASTLAALLLAAPALRAQVVFEPPAPTTVAGSSFSSSAEADVNGDGVLDLLFNGNTSDTYVLLGTGGGAFAGPSAIALPAIETLFAVDLNNDGDVDLAGLSLNILWTALGNGDGTFATATTTTLDDFAAGMSFGEWTGDGVADLVVVAPSFFGITPLRVLARPGLGDGTFGAPTTILDDGTLNFGTALAGDLTGDGATEVIVFDAATSTEIFTNRRTFSISALGVATELSNVPVFSGADAAVTEAQLTDVDDDGNLDLVKVLRAAAVDGALVEVSLGGGDGTFAAPSSFGVDVNIARELSVADFSGDGVDDIALIAVNARTVNIFTGNGDGTFEPSVVVSIGPLGLTNALVMSDFDVDGRADLLVATPGFPTTTELEVLRNFTYGPTEPILDLGQAWPGAGLSYPILLVDGTLAPDSDIAFDLFTVQPGLTVWLVVGASELHLPLGKATVVPALDTIIGPLTMPAAGGLQLAGRWPIGLPAGFEVWAQFVVKDPGTMGMIATSSAVLLTNP